MSDEIKVSRSSQGSQQSAMRPDMMQSESDSSGSSSKAPWVILALVVVVIVVLGVLFRGKLFKGAGSEKMAGTPSSSGYQAVFLTNGQVYFGKISSPNSDYVTLTDIYYLQVGPQQGSGTNAQGQPTQAPQQSISLVKLGNELHGPVDEMHISRAQVLFYEDLKSEGSVVKAIAAYKANPTGAPAK